MRFGIKWNYVVKGVVYRQTNISIIHWRIFIQFSLHNICELFGNHLICPFALIGCVLWYNKMSQSQQIDVKIAHNHEISFEAHFYSFNPSSFILTSQSSHSHEFSLSPKVLSNIKFMNSLTHPPFSRFLSLFITSTRTYHMLLYMCQSFTLKSSSDQSNPFSAFLYILFLPHPVLCCVPLSIEKSNWNISLFLKFLNVWKQYFHSTFSPLSPSALFILLPNSCKAHEQLIIMNFLLNISFFHLHITRPFISINFPSNLRKNNFIKWKKMQKISLYFRKKKLIQSYSHRNLFITGMMECDSSTFSLSPLPPRW